MEDHVLAQNFALMGGYTMIVLVIHGMKDNNYVHLSYPLSVHHSQSFEEKVKYLEEVRKSLAEKCTKEVGAMSPFGPGGTFISFSELLELDWLKNTRSFGLPAVYIEDYPAIKLSDFDASRADFNLGERALVIMPDKTWSAYVKRLHSRGPVGVSKDESPRQ